MNRLPPRETENHEYLVDWLNSLLYDISYWVLTRKEQPAVPDRYYSNWELYRTELEACSGHGDQRPASMMNEPLPQGWPKTIHGNEIKLINALVLDLRALWSKQEPKRPITEIRINEIEQVALKLKECRHDPKHH